MHKITILIISRLLIGVIIVLGNAVCAFSDLKLEEAFPMLSFTLPLDIQHPGDGTNRLFVVENRGVINVFENAREIASKTVFLNIEDSVDDSGTEMGLLGLAFHPDYETNGYFYVDYTAGNPRRTVISRFSVNNTNPNAADPASEFKILEVNQPYSNHNGGQIVFGPDGFLYIAFGDGGSAGDPQGNGQNRATILGSIIRIDIDNPSGSRPYGIPADNPFAGNTNGYREEIYAYGLRNPWRFSFDAGTGQIWCADVGQNQWEEVDIIQKGGNYGWNITEGKQCYNATNCDKTGLILPVIDYNHSQGQSITGGFVYHGKLVPELTGSYIYADYVSGRIWKLTYSQGAEPENELIEDTELSISTFGVDAQNELYLTDYSNGKIYKLTSTTSGVKDKKSGLNSFPLHNNYPNPFNAYTTLSFSLQSDCDVRLSIMDITGQIVENLLSGRFSSGRHNVLWDGGKYASGPYITRLESGGNIWTRKIMMVK